jgi:hypothetical protein
MLAFVAAIALGAGIGAGEVLAAGRLSPAAKQVVYSRAVSEAVNNAAVFTVVLVPAATVIVFVRRRWRRRP